MRGRILLPLLLALLGGWPSARAADPTELRVPASVLQRLAQPDATSSLGLSSVVLSANPGAAAVYAGGDLTRFWILWTLPDRSVLSLSADRSVARRLARGAVEDLGKYLALPPGYALGTVTASPDGLHWTLVASPAERPETAKEAQPPGFWQELSSHARNTFRLLGSERYLQPTLGGLNPDNKVLESPAYTTEVEARPDLALEWDRMSVSAKPRARWTLDSWRHGPESGDSHSDVDLFLLEGLAKVRVSDSAFVSYGRENLQWGPGQFMSPSNPFFAENGRDNPVREIPGMDFVRGVWLPGGGWTASWIADTGPGKYDLAGSDWHPSQAVKVDYVGPEASGAVLYHTGKDESPSVRGYGQWTASDALLAYAEASLSKGTRALYPSDGRLEATRKNSPNLIPTLLLGGSYTLESGPTLSLEYIYNAEGFNESEADRSFDLAHRFGQAVDQGLIPAGTELPSLRRKLLRKNYLFFQYLQTGIQDKVDIILRWAENVDDRSTLLTGFADCALADRWRLFGFTTWATGGNRDEFGSLIRFQGILGIEFTAF